MLDSSLKKLFSGVLIARCCQLTKLFDALDLLTTSEMGCRILLILEEEMEEEEEYEDDDDEMRGADAMVGSGQGR